MLVERGFVVFQSRCFNLQVNNFSSNYVYIIRLSKDVISRLSFQIEAAKLRRVSNLCTKQGKS